MPDDVVLLPSLGRPASDFTDLVHRLENNSYTAHPIEPPRSVAAGANLHDVAAGVVTQLSERGVRSFHLVGHAFGNRLARMIAADFPDHIASLTLLAAGGYVPIPPKVLESLVACFDTSLPIDEHVHHVGRAFFAPGHDPSSWASGWMPEVASWQTAALEATEMEDWWDATAPHVLVIQGLADAVAPPENGRRYVHDHADVARLVEIPDAGHALILEQADRVGQAVVCFLLEVDGAGARVGPS